LANIKSTKVDKVKKVKSRANPSSKANLREEDDSEAEESSHASSALDESDESVKAVHKKKKALRDSESDDSGNESSSSEVSQESVKVDHKKVKAVESSGESGSDEVASDSEESSNSESVSVGSGDEVVVMEELIDTDDDSSASASEGSKNDSDGCESESSDSSISGDNSSVEEVKEKPVKKKKGRSSLKAHTHATDSENENENESEGECNLEGKKQKSSKSTKIDFSDELFAALREKNKESAQNAVSVHVSQLMTSDCGTKEVVVAVFDSLGPVWYMQSRFLDNTLKVILDKLQFFDPKKGTGSNGSIKVMPVCLRKHEHGDESLYRRTGVKKNPIERMMIVLQMDQGKTDVMSLLRKAVEALFSTLHARKTNSAGEMLLDHIYENKPNLHAALLKNHGGPDKSDKKLAAKAMTNHMDSVFKHDPDYHYDTKLDKFLVDNDIKQLMINQFGASSWDDLSENVKKACYKNYPGKKFLPDWDSIVSESYNSF
jgi:hypothetical protein